MIPVATALASLLAAVLRDRSEPVDVHEAVKLTLAAQGFRPHPFTPSQKVAMHMGKLKCPLGHTGPFRSVTMTNVTMDHADFERNVLYDPESPSSKPFTMLARMNDIEHEEEWPRVFQCFHKDHSRDISERGRATRTFHVPDDLIEWVWL